ncbi:MAG: extracellular solute-binding protein [Lachnospiraceae bacterium]|nr:extracellular solute-binding protein [Lachnospiraceae bacterium]
MRPDQNRHSHTIFRVLSVFVIVALLLSGCVGPNGPTEPGKTTESGRTTESPSSEQGTDTPSEVIIRTLADQRSEWTEGQFYPGAYTQEKISYTVPSAYSNSVLESDAIVYAYGSWQNADNTGMEHLIRKNDGTKEEDMILSEIPEDYTLYQMHIGSDTVYLLARQREAASDVQHLELFIYSTTGEFRLRKKLTDILESEDALNSGVGAFTDQHGKLWIYRAETENYTCIEPDGQASMKISRPEEAEGGLMRGRGADELTSALRTDNGLRLGKLNTKTGASEERTIEGLPGVIKILPGTMYDALVVTEERLYGVTLEEAVLVKELLVFSDLGIDQETLKSVEDHEDGSIAILLLAQRKPEGERILLKPSLTKVRNGLTLACLKSNDYLVYAVAQYNQEHPNDKITIKPYFDKYAVDASETDALNRLNSDLMDGTAGDIICLDGISFAGGGKALAEKGIFADLYELMDNDPEFHKEDYFTDIFRVNETDGKLYRLVPFFSLNTKYGRVDDVGETTHIDESLLFETEPVTNLFGFFYRRTEFIHDSLVFSMGDFRDKKALLYDTDQMTRYIEVAGQLPQYPRYGELGEEEIYEEEGKAYVQQYRGYRDQVIRFHCGTEMHSQNVYFMGMRFASSQLAGVVDRNLYSDDSRDFYMNQVGVQVAFSGFPVKEGCGSAVINQLTLAIPQAADARVEAWQFLKCTLSEQYQSQKKLCLDGIPVLKSTFEQYVAMLIAYETPAGIFTNENDPDIMSAYGVDDPETGKEIKFYIPATQQWMADALVDLLPDITKVDEVDPHVETIVTEEIGKYCDGRQTAEEAARNIAERVELYRDEQ